MVRGERLSGSVGAGQTARVAGVFAMFAGCVVALAIAACGGGGDAAPEIDSPLDGYLVELETADDGTLERIEVRTYDGESVAFDVNLEQAALVTVDHLREHIELEQPVRVTFVDLESADDPVAVRIDDAPTR